MKMLGQLRHADYHVFYVKICVLSMNGTKNPQHLDCCRSIPATHGGKTIPDSAEPRLESFCPPFVAGIDLPHQGVVDSYNFHNGISYGGIILLNQSPRRGMPNFSDFSQLFPSQSSSERNSSIGSLQKHIPTGLHPLE